MFNIIARKALLAYCKQYPDAEIYLLDWYHEFLKNDFKNFNELKKKYGNASIVKDNRVVFNVCGNKYWLVIRILFEYKTIQLKWFGTHTEYDKIEVEQIKHKLK